MSDSTLRVRLFEAQYHSDAMLAFACLSRVLNTRQRMAIIQSVIHQNALFLTLKEAVNENY